MCYTKGESKTDNVNLVQKIENLELQHEVELNSHDVNSTKIDDNSLNSLKALDEKFVWMRMCEPLIKSLKK